jgi:hypothetical protein
MAEIEIAILERNALSRRLPDEAALRRHVSAVETERNQQRRGIAWQFTTRDARRKLTRLYPVKAPSLDEPGLFDQLTCVHDSSLDEQTVASS